jgi:hypothetical protein
VTDRLDAIAVRVDEERAVVVLVVGGTRAGRAVVHAACGQAGGMEGVDLRRARRPECPVPRSAGVGVERNVTPGTPGSP